MFSLIATLPTIIKGTHLLFCYRTQGEGKRKKEEEKKREVCLTNRQRVELFKKVISTSLLQNIDK